MLFRQSGKPLSICDAWLNALCFSGSRVRNQSLKTTISMAPARRARSPDDGDTESDFEQETPRNNKLKKRLSEIHRPGDDDGTIEGRDPLRSVNITDDAAEKRRRRKRPKLQVTE